MLEMILCYLVKWLKWPCEMLEMSFYDFIKWLKWNYILNLCLSNITCEYHINTIFHSLRGRFEESTTQLRKLAVGNWAISR